MADFLPASEERQLQAVIKLIEDWRESDIVKINAYGWPSFAAGALNEHAIWTTLYNSLCQVGAKDRLQKALLRLYTNRR